MKLRFFPQVLTFACCVSALAPKLVAQNSSIQLFGPVDVRLSQSGAGYGASADIFNTTTLNLSCSASPTAVLSSTPDGSGNVLVDNNIYVSNPTANNGPTNVCTGGTSDQGGTLQDCFTPNYQSAANQGNITNADPDSSVATWGVPPINIST